MSVQYKRSPNLHQRYTILDQCKHDVTTPEMPHSPTTSSDCGKEKLPNLHPSKTEGRRLTYQELTDDEKNGYAEFIRSLNNGRSSSRASLNSERSPRSNLSLSMQSTYGLADVLKLKKKNDEKHEMTMKVIEDHMWQHKQEERELKRAEGDILKKQLQLKRTMASYSADMNKRKRRREQQAYNAILDLEKKKRDYGINEKKRTMERLNRNIGFQNQQLDKGRKGMLAANGLEFQYQKTVESLRIKRQDIDSLTKEFELKLKKKEDEEYELKKRLAELSITLNMEAQKKRKQDDFHQREQLAMNQQDVMNRNANESALAGDLRQSMQSAIKNERNKQDLDRYLNEKSDDLSALLREEDRRLADVRNKLAENTNGQKNLKAAAQHTATQRENDKSDEKVRLVTAKRNEKVEAFSKMKQLQNMETMNTWKLNNLTKTNEADLQDKEDDILHLKKSVKKQKNSETLMFTKAKSSESRKVALEQKLNKLENLYEERKQKNAKVLKDTASKFNKEEEALKNKILRERSELAKAFNEREDCIQNLVKLRVNMSKDKDVLDTEMKAHERLNRIGLRTAEAQRQLVS